MAPKEKVLSVEKLSIEYISKRGAVQAVRNVSFDLYAGENLCIIGESGSGKTTMGMSLVKLSPPSAVIKEGNIVYTLGGKQYDVRAMSESQLRAFRWKEVAMVFQGALNAFNPVIRINKQFLETGWAHGMKNNNEIIRRSEELLRFVQLDPNRVLNAYQHELSGGMKQRVLIAMSLLLDPKILIMDECTSALDILTQRTIINLLKRIKAEMGIAFIFVSHDLSLAAELADRIVTVYAGRVVEMGTTEDIFKNAVHPYTRGLIKATPTVTGEEEGLTSIKGTPPDLIRLPAGCKFNPRCEFPCKECYEDEPELVAIGKEHYVACLRADQSRS
jgi:peptide/nickel transport system ATP-binding protein